MKKLTLILALVSASAFAQNMDTSRRQVNLQADWQFISCRQLENGGVTIQRRNLPENSFVTVMATTSSPTTYEIFADGNILASCRFITVKN